MFRGFAYAMAVYVLSSSTPALSENALPNDANANALFVDAVQTYKHAENLPKEQARGKYELVRLYFEQVVAGYPSTNAGRAILSQENPAGVNLQKISFSVDKVGSINATDGAKSVASDILKRYAGDLKRINLVANVADYAILSWAAYGDEEGLRAAGDAGWREVQGFEVDRLLVGDVSAKLFIAGDGETVLAFRGSATRGDWVTNLYGTGSPSTLFNEQVDDALELAAELSKKYPKLGFTGHSLGGRLAQAASMKTGHPAVIFNSAPLGLNEMRELGFGGLQEGKVSGFRSPQDQVSGFFRPQDVEISNIEVVDAGTLANFSNLKDYTHAIHVLAGAAKTVKVARNEGWLTALLRDMATSPTNVSPAVDEDWGPNVVAELNREPGYTECGGSGMEDCWRELGMNEEAVKFSASVTHPDDIAFTRATAFYELGSLDLVQAERNADPSRQDFIVNGPTKELLVQPTHYLAGVFQDETSRRIIRQYPEATSWFGEVYSHRTLPNGTQRFVLAEIAQDQCRGCRIIGSAVTFLEFGDETGDMVRRVPIGLHSSTVDYFKSVTPQGMRTQPAVLQLALNLRGYDAGPMDGAVGQQTIRALREFQADHCLEASGALNETVVSLLGSPDRFGVPPCNGLSSDVMVAQAVEPPTVFNGTQNKISGTRMSGFLGASQGGTPSAEPHPCNGSSNPLACTVQNGFGARNSDFLDSSQGSANAGVQSGARFPGSSSWPTVSTTDVAATGVFGSWYDGGPNCAHTENGAQTDELILRLWYCEVGIENSMPQILRLLDGVYMSEDRKTSLIENREDEIRVILVEDIPDKLGNTIGPNTAYNPVFRRSEIAFFPPKIAQEREIPQGSGSNNDSVQSSEELSLAFQRCAIVENDIARLQCFDGLSAQTEKNEPSAQEVPVYFSNRDWTQLLQMMNFRHRLMKWPHTAQVNDCKLQLKYVVSWVKGSLQGIKDVGATIDLRLLDTELSGASNMRDSGAGFKFVAKYGNDWSLFGSPGESGPQSAHRNRVLHWLVAEDPIDTQAVSKLLLNAARQCQLTAR